MDTNNNGTNPSRLGGIFLIIGWLFVLGLMAMLVHNALFAPKGPQVLIQQGFIEITLLRDRDMHFRIPGTMNGVEIAFLVDTGATTIAISDSIAKRCNLPRLSQVTTQTASGTAVGYLTRIDSLNIQGFEFSDLSAIIVPSMHTDMALLGMNVLQHFKIQQTKEKMILSSH